MAKLQEAPIYDPVIEGNEGKARLSWTLFFNKTATGDVGTPWAPVPVNLANVGGPPTVSGTYYQNQGWTDFWILIRPVTSTTSTAGSTYIDVPFTVFISAPAAVTTGVNSNYTGAVDAATRRCYLPSWSAITVPIVVTGRVKN